MRSLTASGLLDLWERGLPQSLEQRMLLLLHATDTDHSLEEIADTSIGRRDSQLLTLREMIFGAQASMLADCPHCQMRVQFDLNLAELRAPMSEQPNLLMLDHDDYHVSFRLPNSFDLIAIAGQPDIDIAHRVLLQRCITNVDFSGEPCTIDLLPPAVLDEIEQRMEGQDQQAQVMFALACPQCEHTWSVVFDIATFFWEEINAFIIHLLRDIHTLAISYGWCESDILALSQYRRQIYLELNNR